MHRFSFSSLFLGIRLATYDFQGMRCSCRMSFSSLFLGIRLATHNRSTWVVGGRSLSVPFSSGSALQPCSDGIQGLLQSLSVPFSSGSALQPVCKRPLGLEPSHAFSSLFLGIRLATREGEICSHSEQIFQFPFPRDPPCNYTSKGMPMGTHSLLSVPFSSGSALQQPF